MNVAWSYERSCQCRSMYWYFVITNLDIREYFGYVGEMGSACMLACIIDHSIQYKPTSRIWINILIWIALLCTFYVHQNWRIWETLPSSRTTMPRLLSVNMCAFLIYCMTIYQYVVWELLFQFASFDTWPPPPIHIRPYHSFLY